MSPTRRMLLLAGAVALGLRLPAARLRAAPASDAVARLKALAGPPRSARALGLAYLARRPEEASAPLLAGLVLQSLGLTAADLAALDDQRLRALLAARIRDDFAAERTATAGGWILSCTEARLMALAV
ncbi:MAG: hypothetical protein ACLQJR_18250 [Stellaceae bacterium]